jgi:hypothetical protein
MIGAPPSSPQQNFSRASRRRFGDALNGIAYAGARTQIRVVLHGDAKLSPYDSAGRESRVFSYGSAVRGWKFRHSRQRARKNRQCISEDVFVGFGASGKAFCVHFGEALPLGQ